MSTKENKIIVQRYFEDLVNQGNLAIAAEIIAPQYVAIVEQLTMLVHTAFPDFQITVEDQIAERDKVATLFTATGTHQGKTTFTCSGVFPGNGGIPTLVSPKLPPRNLEEWPSIKKEMLPTGDQFTIPPTGKQLRYIGTYVFRIANGKIMDIWGGWGPQLQSLFEWLGHR